MVLLWRSGRVVKAFDSNLSRLWVSNPFVGKSSNLLGVDILFLFLLVSLYISYLEGRYMEEDRAEFPFVCNGWCVCTFRSPQIFVSFGGQRAIVIRRGNIGFKRRSGLFFFVFIEGKILKEICLLVRTWLDEVEDQPSNGQPKMQFARMYSSIPYPLPKIWPESICFINGWLLAMLWHLSF
jgi:hypothetical protein